jgi:hypothetical protein
MLAMLLLPFGRGGGGGSILFRMVNATAYDSSMQPQYHRSLEFGDYAEIPEECPAITTCPGTYRFSIGLNRSFACVMSDSSHKVSLVVVFC